MTQKDYFFFPIQFPSQKYFANFPKSAQISNVWVIGIATT
jgi:hypothetical protein